MKVLQNTFATLLFIFAYDAFVTGAALVWTFIWLASGVFMYYRLYKSE